MLKNYQKWHFEKMALTLQNENVFANDTKNSAILQCIVTEI